MNENNENPATLWENLLSRDSNLIRVTFTHLGVIPREQVLKHLKHMAEQPGWHKEQVISAKFALVTLRTQANDDREVFSGS